MHVNVKRVSGQKHQDTSLVGVKGAVGVSWKGKCVAVGLLVFSSNL